MEENNASAKYRNNKRSDFFFDFETNIKTAIQATTILLAETGYSDWVNVVKEYSPINNTITSYLLKLNFVL